MGRIITLDAYDTEAESPPTQANFPALKHCFLFDEEYTADPNAQFTDGVGGVKLTIPNATSSGGVMTGNAGTFTLLDEGAWEESGNNKAILVLTMASNAGSNITLHIGNTTIDYSRYRITTAQHLFHDGTTSCATAALSILAQADNMICVGFDPTSGAAGCSLWQHNDVNCHLTGAAGDGTALDFEASSGIAPQFNFNLTACSGIMIFHFDELPADVLEAIRWMRPRWQAGERVIWPGWRNRS